MIKIYHFLLNHFQEVNRCYGMQQGIIDKNEDCLLFNARFDKNNQYDVIVKYKDGIQQSYPCFKWMDRYHISKTQSIFEDYIIEIHKCI